MPSSDPSPSSSKLPSLLRRAHTPVPSSSLSAPSLSAPTPPRHLPRSSSLASLSPAALSPPPRKEDDAESDASSEFESLLERVGGKGKERQLEGVLLAQPEVEEESEDEGEVVGREEGSVDPRDMLRAQLRRSESRGREVSKVRGVGALEDLSELPLPPKTRYSPRRYFILSTAGKLIFTTDSDEEEATGYVGVMQAIISIFADEGDKLRYVDAGSTKLAFLLKPPLYLVCVSDWGEPESVLRNHLEYLYLQVLSVVTLSQLQAIFAKRSNFDLRRLLEGTEPFFTNLVATLQTSLPILTSSLEVYRLDSFTRSLVAKALAPPSTKDLLYALVLSSSRLVTLLRPSSHSVHPTDLHLLLSTLLSSAAFRTPHSESWIPICLPRYNSAGFLHAYISFVSGKTGVVLLGGEREGFERMREWGVGVKKRLCEGGLLKRVEEMAGAQDYSLAELAIPGLRHFMYKSKTFVQVTFPAYEGDYEQEENKLRLITLYQHLHDSLHARPPSKLIYLRTAHEAVLGWTTLSFELYLALSPLLPKSAAVSAARAVMRWVKGEESRLFLTSAPSF